jgi:hypothetical protein
MDDDLFRFQVELERVISQLKKKGLGKEAVASLARTLQSELASDAQRRSYPYSQSLECIMRAVAGTLEIKDPADPNWNRYILEKLQIGVQGLVMSLKGNG